MRILTSKFPYQILFRFFLFIWFSLENFHPWRIVFCVVEKKSQKMNCVSFFYYFHFISLSLSFSSFRKTLPNKLYLSYLGYRKGAHFIVYATYGYNSLWPYIKLYVHGFNVQMDLNIHDFLFPFNYDPFYGRKYVYKDLKSLRYLFKYSIFFLPLSKKTKWFSDNS